MLFCIAGIQEVILRCTRSIFEKLRKIGKNRENTCEFKIENKSVLIQSKSFETIFLRICMAQIFIKMIIFGTSEVLLRNSVESSSSHIG